MDTVRIFDTSLRDGEQSPGFSMTPEEKLRLAAQLEDLGVDVAMALDDLVAGRPVRTPLTNPIGCNVKWKGQDAHWMPAEACDLV